MDNQDLEQLPIQLKTPGGNRGKWTTEEERYADQIIVEFSSGTLDIPAGESLRAYLAKMLNCDPMRISKRYRGDGSIGNRTFVPLSRIESNAEAIRNSILRLNTLREAWINKLSQLEPCKPYKRRSAVDTSEFSVTQQIIHFRYESFMRTSLRSILRSDEEVNEAMQTVSHFCRSLQHIPSTNDVELAIERNIVTLSQLYAILISGCCQVDDPVLRHLHQAIANYVVFKSLENDKKDSKLIPGFRKSLFNSMKEEEELSMPAPTSRTSEVGVGVSSSSGSSSNFIQKLPGGEGSSSTLNSSDVGDKETGKRKLEDREKDGLKKKSKKDSEGEGEPSGQQPGTDHFKSMASNLMQLANVSVFLKEQEKRESDDD